MLIQNVYGPDRRSLAIIREEALRGDNLQARVGEAVASLLDPFQPDDDEASRLANPAPKKITPSD